MKPNFKSTLFLGLAAICFTAGSLRAQDIKGSFTLTSQTKWGSSVLPAGDYTLAFQPGLSPVIVLRNKHMVGAGMVLTTAFSATSTEGSSMFVAEGRVLSLHLAPAGGTYYFRQPKKERGPVLARKSGVPGVYVAINAK